MQSVRLMLCSFGGLVVLSPIYAGIAVVIKIDNPGPVLFTQKRIRQNKQYFKLRKSRSMKRSTPHDIPMHMLDNPEQNITRVGKFLRVHSLDELPRIWDIFIGKYVYNWKRAIDIVNITLHFFLKDVRSMLPPAVNHSIAVS